jgi:O-antigen ligase
VSSTAPSPPWWGASPSEAPRPQPRQIHRAKSSATLTAALAVFILLIFSQAWVKPLIGDQDEESASGLIRAIYYPAYGAGLLLLVRDARAGLRALKASPLLVALCALAGASVLWSVDPDTTVRRAVAVVLTSLCGIALAARLDWPGLARALAVCFAAVALASLFVGVFVPSVGRMTDIFPGSWRGLWSEKNWLGDMMAMGFALFGAAVALDRARSRLWLGFAGLALLLVLLSTSKTSLVALAAGAAALVFVWLARRGPAAGVAMVWLAVVALAGVGAVAILAPGLAIGALGKDATLTGRTFIWAAAVRVIHQRPWLGFGYGAVWDNLDAWGPLTRIIDEAGFRPRHAHSSWIEMALNLGLVGLGLWALWFAQTLVRALAAVFTSRAAYLALPFLTVYGLISLTESLTLIWNDLRWVVFTAVAVKLAIRPAAAPRTA